MGPGKRKSVRDQKPDTPTEQKRIAGLSLSQGYVCLGVVLSFWSLIFYLTGPVQEADRTFHIAICVVLHWLSKHFLRTYYAPDNVLGDGDSTVTRTWYMPFTELTVKEDQPLIHQAQYVKDSSFIQCFLYFIEPAK